jgi:hypothetical protein
VAVKDLGLEIDEMFYMLFPHHRPETEEQRAAREEQKRREAEAHQRWLESLSPAERRAYDREQERLARQAARDNKQYWAQIDRENAKKRDLDGLRNGRVSADQVDLGRTSGVQAQTRKAL